MSALENALEELSHLSPTCVEEARAELKVILDLLKEIEWEYNDYKDDHFCSWCRRRRGVGHAPDCKLNAVLERYK
jgi:hypothetical protein